MQKRQLFCFIFYGASVIRLKKWPTYFSVKRSDTFVTLLALLLVELVDKDEQGR
jgi:hypothetical protein